MGLKCRLFGHTYGNPEVERSRKEEGDEVVVTIRNVKRCERCGDEKMVNQTKEVTSVRTPEEVGLNAAEDDSATPNSASEGDGGPPTGPESPVTPVESEPTPAAEPTPDLDAAADATADGDAEPTVEIPTEFRGGGIDDSTAADPAEDAADARPESGDTPGTDGEWDAETVVEEPDEQTGTAGVEPSAADDPDEGVASERDEGRETGSDEGWETGSDEGRETGSDEGRETGSDEGRETGSDEGRETGSDEGWETGSDDWDDVEPDPDVDDAVILDAGETERDDVQWPEDPDADPDPATDAVDSEAPHPADERRTTDAEIIDAREAEAEPAGGSAGGWPENDDTGGADGWPDHEGADEGYSATPNGDIDAEFAGDGLTPEANGGAPDDPVAVDGITVGGGAAEGAHADAGTDSDPEAGGDTGTGEGFVRAGKSTADDVPADRVEFYCPNCEHARVAGASPIRAGDICPGCKQGYIAERER
ncbi:hypothetical protein GCM10008995_13900 [Halobellus salinus]|uniref:Uncharacterized protein n=1 Tax=Halobellus salinus TaxID=931585 RepID=A0A830EAD1_9EURY|nr:hypothetical protein [Halobellus salinus]GGJ05265.1 hypothetical protein GCM10008995_13900 [Halobellus salinus]SMP23195.1 hypothetical protein SAMN06265347_10936 [Halobellus salinus]